MLVTDPEDFMPNLSRNAASREKNSLSRNIIGIYAGLYARLIFTGKSFVLKAVETLIIYIYWQKKFPSRTLCVREDMRYNTQV